MGRRIRVALALAATIALAGCIGVLDDGQLAVGTSSDDDPTEEAEEALEDVGTPVVQSHDHKTPELHGDDRNADLENYNDLVPEDEFGSVGYGEIEVNGDTALVARLGTPGGFWIVDVSDPSNTEVVGSYTTFGGSTYDVKFCRGTDYAVVGIQDPASNASAAEAAASGSDAAVAGFQVVDISDPSNPEFVAAYANPPAGSHNVFCYTGMDDRVILTSTSSNFVFDPTGEVGLLASDPVFTKVEIAELVETPSGQEIMKRGSYRIVVEEQASFLQQRSLNNIVYVHDMYVQQHPDTGQHLLYVAHWEAGVRIVDISNPSAPEEIGSFEEKGPAQYNNIHYVQPSPQTIDGRHVTVLGPELLTSQTSGYLRVLDTSDPTNPEVMSYWKVPGDLKNTKQLIFSPHNFDIWEGKLYLGSYHAGSWIVDISNETRLKSPKAVGYFGPNAGDRTLEQGDTFTMSPYFEETRVPNVWGADYNPEDGHMYVSDVSTGLYAVKPAGPAS
jgi:hypothetical protein